ncbi:MAG: hydroxysqualene dehydroxylase HpnE [Alphaproteobacteria bacterium]|nr:hydroxysqualene dehydroxylase HpnE [Alphaproteobacteria bacterium]
MEEILAGAAAHGGLSMANGRRVHVVGAGMAGLAAALQLSLAGESVILYEGANFAGGRCRSFQDRELGCLIDNGNHLVLSGNVAIQDYLFLTNARATMSGPGAAIFPFLDLASGERWTVKMNEGRIPWWIFNKNRRIAGTTPLDYLSALRVMTSSSTDRVADRLDTKSLFYKRFWEPLVIGALNTEAETSSAKLLANIFMQSFGAGGRACHPLIPKQGLSESFVHPCLEVLKQKNVEIKYSHRLGEIKIVRGAVRELQFNRDKVDVAPKDWVVLALPAWVTKALLPKVTTPLEFRSIINAHYRVDGVDPGLGFIGLLGGIAEWAFIRNGVVSATVSCAERYSSYPVRDLATSIWHDLAQLCRLDPEKVPPRRIFKEQYATFAATPEQNMLRPSAYTGWSNLALAGEWTDTGLPSTIEGAIRSGFKAAQLVMRWTD